MSRRGAMTDVLDIVLLVVALIALVIAAGQFIAMYIDELRRENERCGRWWR